jgi:hypothetical protein
MMLRVIIGTKLVNYLVGSGLWRIPILNLVFLTRFRVLTSYNDLGIIRNGKPYIFIDLEMITNK